VSGGSCNFRTDYGCSKFQCCPWIFPKLRTGDSQCQILQCRKKFSDGLKCKAKGGQLHPLSVAMTPRCQTSDTNCCDVRPSCCCRRSCDVEWCHPVRLEAWSRPVSRQGIGRPLDCRHFVAHTRWPSTLVHATRQSRRWTRYNSYNLHSRLSTARGYGADRKRTKTHVTYDLGSWRSLG